MKKLLFIVLLAFMGAWCNLPALAADVGVTDSCQEDVRELEEKIKNNKDDYTAESRRKAKTQLTAAKTNRLNPVKCRQNILDAREELRKGKREKQKSE